MNAMNKKIALNINKFHHALDRIVIVCPQSLWLKRGQVTVVIGRGGVINVQYRRQISLSEPAYSGLLVPIRLQERVFRVLPFMSWDMHWDSIMKIE